MKFLNSTLPAFATLLIALGCGGQTAMAAGKVLTVGPKGQYKTIQAAIDAAPTHSRKPIVITIAPGTYKELVTVPSDDTNIVLKGTSAKKTIIT